jgi:hypothetical protein
MPAVVSAHVALRARLRDSAGHAVILDGKLEALIAERPAKSSGGFHGKIDFSQPPWHAPVANCHLELHSLSRRLEREMRWELVLPQRARGGSNANTRKALEAVCRLGEGTDDFMVRLVTKELEKWSRRASIALELTEVPKRLPRNPGGPEPKCPFCENHTLRSRSLEGKIYCISPGCKDEEGRKPEARMEYSPVTGGWEVVWQDNVVGLPA